ncbi:MAG: folylpolyglutamate synthase/dihydrofolate synthase family protein [Bacteroidota bacterium]|nr:folylpolyglutamate synthase/dihydrofolate synthase family protein [Bacteroidota bacterium]MDP4214730.1 folylpolyglutamate synthase/dihydrofolate synthase family protein [Bacteroidota bacterium]MDP4247776.1 folylpolyglutamate synthase/dihydrofolate synthase family protein [Bacteroidota bacterium]MDP4257681.1 folylpolyglutamate synthase/dihydrofolate synthase family protein [Bacteroidota bacterium]
MDYAQTLSYLFERLPMFTRIGAAAYRKDLFNTIALLESLGNPQHRFKSVHVAGTNGKGSTSHMLAAIFQTAGYKTGLYTSPHLRDFRERIRINGAMIPERQVTDLVERIQPVADRIDPSFFEVTVAMAFDYFAAEQVDIAIVEVGLGGRLDSTNVITPEVSVITQIGFDHMNLLGNTLEEIAGEKAGIIKPGVPVVIGEYHPVTAPVFEEKAKTMGAPLSYADRERWVAEWSFERHALVAEVSSRSAIDKEYYHLDLPGIYQTHNLVTVLEAVHVLAGLGWRLPHAQVHQALKQVRKLTGLHGRWELIHEHPDVVLDVAHNEDGIRQLVRQMELTDHEDLHIVFGMVRDKEIDRVLDLLPRQAVYYFTRAQLPRSLPEDQLAERAGAKGLRGKAYPTVMEALTAAREHARERDLVLVCGSVFVVGEVEGRLIR